MAALYAQFHKCALQVNPYSYSGDYAGRAHGLTEEAYNAAIAERCIANGITLVGIADHGSAEGVDNLRATLEASGIVVFPGFEIASTEKVHMVCLYPAQTTTAMLNRHLGALGLPPGGPPTAPSTLGCLDIARRVADQGGFWFAAHATTVSGLLRLQRDGGGLHHIWCDCDLVLAAQIPADVESQEEKIRIILQNKNAEYSRKRPIALLNAKDVKQPSDLDNPRCCSWIKMTEPTLDALRLACRDPESRVRLSHEVNPSYYSRIERIVVHRGYLDGLDMQFSPNLNAIVGGRGTGKSTLVEAIRYALELGAIGGDAQDAHDEIVNSNLARERASVELTVTSFAHNSEAFTIIRQHGEPARVADSDGRVVSFRPRDILPSIEVYGQNELLQIVQNEASKASLLTRFLPEGEALQAQIDRLHGQLERNGEAMLTIEKQIATHEENLRQLPPLLEREHAFLRLGLQAELKQVHTRETERAHADALDANLDAIDLFVATFEQSVEEVDIPVSPADADPAHAELLAALAQPVRQALAAAKAAAAQARTAHGAAAPALQVARRALDAALLAEERVFQKSVDAMPATKGKTSGQLVAEYREVSKRIATLKPSMTQKTVLETKLQALETARTALLDQLSTARSNRWSALGKATKALNTRLTGLLRIDFEPARIRRPLIDFFLACQIEGVAEARLAWIDTADDISVPALLELIRGGSDVLLARYRDAGMTKVVSERIAALPETKFRELETLELPERLELLLNVSRSGAPNYRPVSRLSTGQQCTAVLHLLLLDNPDPLVIDQPEDNLDNAFIAEHIVGELRMGKTRRQFLFATHNANIPVFGDAEWIGVLQEQEGVCRIEAAGSIDAPAVKELAANILEGGREAFTRRAEKYGLQ